MLKDQLTKQILNGITWGRFEFKKGNTLATLAMVMNATHKSYYGGSKDILYDAQKGDKLFQSGGILSVLDVGTLSDFLHIYPSWVSAVNILIPFYAYFFDYYRPSQKLHVLRFLSNFKVYDQDLFVNFVSQF